VLTEEANIVIARSVLRSALDLKNVNLRALPANQVEDSVDNRNAVIPIPFAEEQEFFQPQIYIISGKTINLKKIMNRQKLEMHQNSNYTIN